MAQPGRPLRMCRWLRVAVGCVRQVSQDLQQFCLQPWVQDDVRRVGHALGTHVAGGRAEQGQEFGCAAADVLMRLAKRLALRSPGLTGLRDGLVRAGLILTPHGNPYAFSDVVGEFDEPLFTSVCGSMTVTTPALRLRCAVPVGHQVRVRWYELPASCSTRRMVLVPSVGKLPRRKVRCKVLSDHVAVPSVRRLGERCAVATICARAAAAYVGRRPRPRAMRMAANPWQWLTLWGRHPVSFSHSFRSTLQPRPFGA